LTAGTRCVYIHNLSLKNFNTNSNKTNRQVLSESGKVLKSAIRGLSMIVRLLGPADLEARLETVLPGVFAAFGSSDADVRKAVVFCLVDMSE
jgi:hypothetical protein